MKRRGFSLVELMVAIFLLAIGATATAGETVELKSEACAACKSQGFTETFTRCEACKETWRKLYLARERELPADKRRRASSKEIGDVVATRMPACATCDKAPRTRVPCADCGGRGTIYFLPNGNKLPPGMAPENEKSKAAQREIEIRSLRAEIKKLEEQLATARKQLEALDAQSTTPKAAPPPPAAPVEVNPREKVSVEMPREKL